MEEHSAGEDDNDMNWNTDDEIDNFESSPCSSPSHPTSSVRPAGTNLVETGSSDEIDKFESSPCSSPIHSTSSIRPAGTSLVESGSFDETVARFIEMGFPYELIVRAIEETNGASSEPGVILETLIKYSATSEATSSKSQLIDQLIAMGFSEELVIKAIQEYGEENEDEITNALLSYTKAENLRDTEDEDINFSLSSDNNDEDNLYSDLFSSDEENENLSHEDSRLKALIKMDYSREEAALAIERCGENASVADIVDLICAAQMARQFDDFFAIPNEEEPIINNKKRRVYNEPPIRRKPSTAIASDHELIRLPNPMIGFGVPNVPGCMVERPVPLPDYVRGPPYFYYENVALAPKGVWATITSHLYDIVPEFVDSKYFCAAARKRGYIHNLPIKGRFQIQPPPHYTIQEAFPSMKRSWPDWDKRTKLNCLLTCIASAQLTNRIRKELEKYDGEPPDHVQIAVLNQCKKWNLVWVGKNKTAPLDAVEMEKLLGFPKDHTRGCITSTERYKSLGNSFQVDTVAYHLSVLKPMFPRGINVLSLFTGIGGGEVALHRLQIPMKVVVSVEISEANQNVLRSFWEGTNQKGQLIEFRDVQELDSHKIEQLMDKFGAFDLVIGGSPCNNLAGGNRHSRVGLQGEQSSLFYDYCRILDAVRDKAARMRR